MRIIGYGIAAVVLILFALYVARLYAEARRELRDDEAEAHRRLLKQGRK